MGFDFFFLDGVCHGESLEVYRQPNVFVATAICCVILLSQRNTKGSHQPVISSLLFYGVLCTLNIIGQNPYHPRKSSGGFNLAGNIREIRNLLSVSVSSGS